MRLPTTMVYNHLYFVITKKKKPFITNFLCGIFNAFSNLLSHFKI